MLETDFINHKIRHNPKWQSDDRDQDQDFRGEISRKFMGYRINDHTLYDSICYDYISID